MTTAVNYTKTFHFISDEEVKSTKVFFPGQNFEPYLIFMSNARSGASGVNVIKLFTAVSYDFS
jgi:hypothetical protein